MGLSVRFRVRTALVVVAFLAALAAWPASEFRQAARERAIVERLAAKGGFFTFEKPNWFLPARPTRATSDEYVRLSPGSGSPEDPRPKEFQWTVDDVQALTGLRYLRELNLEGDVLDEAAYAVLGELKQLKSLRVSQGLWDDERLKYLESLKGLEDLTLEQTQATDDGIARLQKKLPKLAIVDD
jgi:hypothetical protein